MHFILYIHVKKCKKKQSSLTREHNDVTQSLEGVVVDVVVVDVVVVDVVVVDVDVAVDGGVGRGGSILMHSSPTNTGIIVNQEM